MKAQTKTVLPTGRNDVEMAMEPRVRQQSSADDQELIRPKANTQGKDS